MPMPWPTVAFWTMLLVVAALSFAKGGSAERGAAVMLLLAAVGTVLVRTAAQTRYTHVEFGILAIDMALFTGLVLLAFRCGRSWAIGLATLQAITLLGHLGKYLDPDLWRLGYAIMVTGPAYPGLLILALGTLRGGQATATMSNATLFERFFSTRQE